MHPLLDELRHIDQSRRALRSFGWVVGGVLCTLAALLYWRGGWTLSPAVGVLGGAGALLAGFGLAAPGVLRPLHRVWMALAVILGYVMTRVILTAVFYLVVTPIGLVLRLLGKDPLTRRLDPTVASYWIEKPPREDSRRERLERYY